MLSPLCGSEGNDMEAKVEGRQASWKIVYADDVVANLDHEFEVLSWWLMTPCAVVASVVWKRYSSLWFFAV